MFEVSLSSVHLSRAKTDWVFLIREGEGNLCWDGRVSGSLRGSRLLAKGDFGGMAFDPLSNWSNFWITLATDLVGRTVGVLKPFESCGGLPKNKRNRRDFSKIRRI